MSKLPSRQIEFWIAKISDLPTLPSVIHKTIQITNDPNASVSQISKIISQDLVLATRVLRLANSGFYALPGGANNIERAVTILGIDNVAKLVYTAAVFSHFELSSTEPFDIQEFWRHSLSVAIAAETIAREVGLKDPSAIFLAGLVHDIGKLVHFQIAREEFLGVCNYAKIEGLTVLESEQRLGHVGHDDLGYELVRQWHLPVLIREAVQMHHDTAAFTSQSSSLTYPQHVGAVHLANLLVHSMKSGASGHDVVRNPSVEVVKRILGNENALIHIMKSVKKALSKVDPMLSSILSPTA